MATKKKKLPPLPGCLVNRGKQTSGRIDFELPPLRARVVERVEIRAEPRPVRGEWRAAPDGRVRFFPDVDEAILRAFGENAGAEPNQILRDQL